MLPVLPGLYVFVCVVLLGKTNQNRKQSGWAPMFLLALVLITVIETVPSSPDYLSFFNLAAGGSSGGERYLLGSDLDWGQDMARLASYLNAPEHASRSYTIRPFDMQPGLLAAALGPRSESTSEPPHGLFAISVSVSHGLWGYHVSRDKVITYGTNYDWVNAIRMSRGSERRSISTMWMRQGSRNKRPRSSRRAGRAGKQMATPPGDHYGPQRR